MKHLRLILIIFICVMAVFAQSVENQGGHDPFSIEPVLSNLSQPYQNMDQPFEDLSPQTLDEYRDDVKATAYETTRKLCKAYLVSQYQHSHDSNEDIEINFQYLSMYNPYPSNFEIEYPSLSHLEDISMTQSLKEWSKLAGHGLVQPFSAMFGFKDDYIEEQIELYKDSPHPINKIIPWHYYWFKSLYTTFLVESDQFISAAEECLGDRQSISQFADAIIRFDSWSSAPSHIANFGIGGVVFHVSLKTIAWIARPVTKPIKLSFNKLKQKIPLQTQKRLKIGGWSAVGAGVVGGAGFIAANTINKVETQKIVQAEIDSLSFLTTDQKNRFQILADMKNEFTSYYYKIKNSNSAISEHQMTNCIKITCDDGNLNPLYNPFYTFILENFDEETISLIKEDRSFLENQTFSNKDNLPKIYLQLINEHLETIEELLHLLQIQESESHIL